MVNIAHNGEMKYGALIGWGVVVYAVMYLTWSVLLIYGVTIGVLPHAIELLVLVVVTMIAGRELRLHSWHDILPYSFVWALEVALLDAVISVPFGGWEIYYDWNLWLGYALVIVLPLLSPFTRMRQDMQTHA